MGFIVLVWVNVHKSILALAIFLLSTVCLADQHHPQDFLASVQGKPDAGKQIYQHFCATCHAPDPIINLGAPHLGVKKEWTRYTQSQTVEQMVKIIDAGTGAMPARGGCFECSDADLKAAILYMLE